MTVGVCLVGIKEGAGEGRRPTHDTCQNRCESSTQKKKVGPSRRGTTPAMSRAPFENFYEILGVESSVSKEEILRAYRKRSLSVHPDRYKGPDPDGAVEQFLKLTQAKEILGDDKARAAFDNVLRAKAAYAAKQEAQEGGRRRMREDLEQREEAAKRARQGGPSPVEEERQQEAVEAAARAELQQEIERLRRTGRLEPRPPAAAPAAAAKASPAGEASSVLAPRIPPARAAAAAAAARRTFSLVVLWSAGASHTEDSLRATLAAAAPTHGGAVLVGSATIAVVGTRALLELPLAVAEALVQSAALRAKGLQVKYAGGPPAAEQAAAAMATAASASGGRGGEATNTGAAPLCGQTPKASVASVTPCLPAGWRSSMSPTGRPYYYHTRSRTSQWAHPAEFGPGAAVGAVGGSTGAGRGGLGHEEYERVTLARLKEAALAQAKARSGQAAGAAGVEAAS